MLPHSIHEDGEGTASDVLADVLGVVRTFQAVLWMNGKMRGRIDHPIRSSWAKKDDASGMAEGFTFEEPGGPGSDEDGGRLEEASWLVFKVVFKGPVTVTGK